VGIALSICLVANALSAAVVSQPRTSPRSRSTYGPTSFAPLRTVMTEKWIPEFEAAHPNVTVNMTTIPFAGAVSYDTRLLAVLSSGAGPDVWDMGDWNYPMFKESGFLEPLDPATFGYESD
jgi:ABC-type glycerol-3-phosphate transport system substrate-binding protein